MKFRFLPLLLALLPLVCLSQTKISDLPAAATITGTEKSRRFKARPRSLSRLRNLLPSSMVLPAA